MKEKEEKTEYITCPICGQHVKNIIQHLRGSHKIYVDNKYDVLKMFPEFKGPFHISNIKDVDCKCEYCGKTFKRLNALGLHIKHEHPEYFVGKLDKRKCATLECPICHKKFSDIKQHINRTHKLDWGEFCKTYGWDIKLTKNITESYRENLSKNKKKFYNQTERGRELKEKQSELWKDPKNNPVYDVKKLSKSIYKRTMNDNISSINARGVTIHCFGERFRSFNEFMFYVSCIYNNITIEYEPKSYIVRYFNERSKFMSTYSPDFFIKDIGLIELKSSKREVDDFLKDPQSKYNKVISVYKNMGIPYTIIDLQGALDLLNIKIKGFKLRELATDVVLHHMYDEDFHIWCTSSSIIVNKLIDRGLDEDKVTRIN